MFRLIASWGIQQDRCSSGSADSHPQRQFPSVWDSSVWGNHSSLFLVSTKTGCSPFRSAGPWSSGPVLVHFSRFYHRESSGRHMLCANYQHGPSRCEGHTDERYQMLQSQLCSHSRASPGLLPRRVPADHCYPVVPTAMYEQARQRRKPHKPSRVEQTGFTGLLSSQALVPHTPPVAHSLSYGLWAGKYGFMCAHITFGSRETFRSNYGECYLHELQF